MFQFPHEPMHMLIEFFYRLRKDFIEGKPFETIELPREIGIFLVDRFAIIPLKKIP